MKSKWRGIVPERYSPLVQALVISNGVSLFLYALRIFGADSFRFGFLFWNLWLAAIPLPVAALLVWNLRRQRWLHWQNIGLSLLWLIFLPNSFYVATDLIHLHLTGEINILFDVVLFMSCIFNGFVFGFMSLYLVHRELLRRWQAERAYAVVAAVLFMNSFAIYLGRYLRWNTWDIVMHPFGVLFDVSQRVANPVAHPQTVTTTVTFFLLLTSMYLVIWELVRFLKRD